MARIFLTGGTGFLGQFLAIELLKRGCQLVFLARGRNGLTAEERISRALSLVDFGVFSEKRGNYRVVEGDLNNLLDKIAGIDAIFHCAGDVRFQKKFASKIMETNLEGTRRMLAFASKNGISEFHYVSTAFARDFQTNGTVREDDLRLSDFVNPYTESKSLAERKVKKWGQKPGRKISVYAPSIVVGRSTDGLTTAMDGGFYRFIKTFSQIKSGTAVLRGRNLDHVLHLPVHVPGVIGATINIATIDYVATLMADLFFAGVPGVYGIINANAPEYDELLRMSLNVIGISGPSVRRNPKDTKKKSLRILQMGIKRGTRDYLPFVSYAPQFSQENCRRVLGDAFREHPPITQELVNTLLRFALRCEFSKEKVYDSR